MTNAITTRALTAITADLVLGDAAQLDRIRHAAETVASGAVTFRELEAHLKEARPRTGLKEARALFLLAVAVDLPTGDLVWDWETVRNDLARIYNVKAAADHMRDASGTCENLLEWLEEIPVARKIVRAADAEATAKKKAKEAKEAAPAKKAAPAPAPVKRSNGQLIAEAAALVSKIDTSTLTDAEYSALAHLFTAVKAAGQAAPQSVTR